MLCEFPVEKLYHKKRETNYAFVWLICHVNCCGNKCAFENNCNAFLRKYLMIYWNLFQIISASARTPGLSGI